MVLPHRALCLVGLLLAAIAPEARACSVPVFRYALERWAADLYEIDVFYRGELSVEDRRRLDELEERAINNGGVANLEIVRADLGGKLAPDLAELGASLGDVPLPCAVVRVPLGGKPMTVWRGPLEQLEPDALTDSPKRREVCRRLLAGDSVVWLLIGDKHADTTIQARKILGELLPRLAGDIPLPEGLGQPGSEIASRTPLAVKFSIVEIDPTDPAEVWLVRILDSQAAPAKPTGETLIAPVFGRGRVLEIFQAAEVEEQLVADISRFLCAACSCQVKQLNPGFDLLMSTAWERELFEEDQAPATDPSSTRRDAADEVAVLVPIPSGKPELPRTATTAEFSASRPIAWAAAGVGLIALLFAASRIRRT